MLIDYEIFKWLVDMNIIVRPEKPNVRADTKVELDQQSSGMIQNGIIFAKIIRILKRHAQTLSKIPLQTPPNLKQLKDANTAGARVYNWNIIVEALAKLNYRIDNDIKALIIAGDEDMVLEVLKEVFRFIMKFNKLAAGKDREKGTSAMSSVASSDVLDRIHTKFPNEKTLADSVNSPNNYTKQIQSYKALHTRTGVVDLGHVDIEAAVEDTASVMELLIVSLSKALSLNSKQSMALLTNGNKYLAHVIAKGIKGNFDPIIYWYKELYAQAKHVLQLVIKEESTGSVPMILQALKPGLYSKNEEVAQWACRFLSKLAFDFSNVELLPAAWEWFTTTNGGLYAFLACLKRHPDVGPYVVAAITQFGRYNMLELFTVEMKKIFVEPLEYIQNILLMLKPLTEAKFTKDELLASSIVDYLLDLGLKHADSLDRSASPQIRSAALSLLCDLWEIYPAKVEEQTGLPNQILMVAKRGIRDTHNALKIISISYLFRLLENFAAERNPYAPIVFKILTFSLIEHHEDQTLREHLLLNFNQIFQNFSTIPVAVLLEPLVKQIQVSEGSTYVLNLFDFKLLETLANHPKISLKHGVMLLDVLAKTYINNVAFAYLAGPPFLKIAERFIEEDTMQEYLLEFAKLCLSKYYTSVKRKKTKDNFVKKFMNFDDKDDLYTGPSNITPEMEEEILNAQKRGLTINMLRDIISFQSSILNAKFKTLLVYTNSQIKQLTRHDNKGIKYLLTFFGDPNEIIKEYEDESNPAHEKKMVDYRKIPTSEYYGSQDLDRSSAKQGVRQSRQSRQSGSPRYSDRGMDMQREASSPGVKPHLGSLLLEGEEDIFSKLKVKEVSPSPNQHYRYNSEGARSGEYGQDDWDQVHVGSPLDLAKSKSISVDENQYTQFGGATNKAKAKELNNVKKKEKKAADAQRFTRAVEHLESMKQRKIEDKMTKEMIEEYKKLKEEKTKGLLKKKIDQRRQELGIQGKTNNYLIKEDESERKSNVPGKKKPHDLDNIGVVDIEEEEYFQKEAMAIYLKQNIKKFRYLFTKYSMTGAYQKEKSFDKLRVQYNTINQVALLRMVKDNGLHHSISKEEVTQLFKLVNTKLLGAQDLEPMNFESFVKFVVQLGIYLYTQPPSDQDNPAYVDCVKKLMFMIYLAAQGRGEQKLMLDDNAYTGDLDRFEFEELNRQVQENPNMPLPPGYRRAMDNNVNYEYRMPASLKVPPKYKIAYEILDEILHKQFGFHIMEPKPVFSTVIKVVPQVKAEVVNPNKLTKQKSIRELSEERGRSTDFDRRTDREARSHREMSVDRIGMRPEARFVNKAVEDRIKRAEEEKKKKEEQDRRIRQRKQEVEARLKEMAEVRKEREIQKDEQRKFDIKQKEEEERVREEKKRREMEKKKQMLNEYKGKRDVEEKQKTEAERDQSVKKNELRKEVTVQLKQKTETLVKNQLDEKKRRREEEDVQRQQKEEEEKKKDEINKRRIEAKLEKEREKREREREVNAQLIRIFESPPVQDFFTQNTKKLNSVFKNYKESNGRETLIFKEFNTLCVQLNIYPSLISSEDVKLIFRSLTRSKAGDAGLTYDDFLQSLVRIAAKAYPALNELAARSNTGQSAINEMRNIVNQAKQVFTQGEGLDNAEDEYHGLNNVNRDTIEGLMIHFDLPNEEKHLKDKLKNLRVENQKLVPFRDKKRAALQTMGLNTVKSLANLKSASPANRVTNKASPNTPQVKSAANKPNTQKIMGSPAKQVLVKAPGNQADRLPSPNRNGPVQQTQGGGMNSGQAYPAQQQQQQQYPQQQQQQPQTQSQLPANQGAQPNVNPPETTAPAEKKSKWGGFFGKK